MLTTTHVSGEPSADLPSSAAVSSISLRMEFDGLYSSVKELLALSRRMKELWAFGPLGGREGEGERVEGDVRRVVDLMSQVEGGRVRGGAEQLGGRWEELRVGELGQGPGHPQSQAQTQPPAQGLAQSQQMAPNGTSS